MTEAAHTCVNRAPDGGSLPPCVACGERFKAKIEAERGVIVAAIAFWRRNEMTALRSTLDLDAAVAKLVSLGGGK